jgi:GT2 family glycosyltransferase
MRPPRFTIIITCHNQSAFICGAVDSALAQCRPESSTPSGSRDAQRAEIVVVDDCSTDDSAEVLRSYGPQLHFVALPDNRGASAARNAGAALAQGEYLLFLDGDDVLLPCALDVYDRLIEQKKPKIILSRMMWFDEKAPLQIPAAPPREIQFAEYEFLVQKDRQYQPGASAIVIERQAFRAAGGWSAGHNTVEDIDLMLKLGVAGLTLQILAPETKGYRVHGTNVRHRVPAMVAGLHRVIEKEKSGSYPGGSAHRFDRYAIIGAPVFFWIKSAYRAGLYGMAATVFLRGWPMFLAATGRKLRTKLLGRKAPVMLPLDHPTPR